jgi:hypothetical protein
MLRMPREACQLHSGEAGLGRWNWLQLGSQGADTALQINELITVALHQVFGLLQPEVAHFALILLREDLFNASDATHVRIAVREILAKAGRERAPGCPDAKC